LDANAVDGIADDVDRFEAVRQAVTGGRLELLWTHVTIDELAAIPDSSRRARLLTIAASMAKLVPTGAFVTEFSRVDFARLFDDVETFEAFRLGNVKHTRDALVAATAAYEGAAVVTDDVGLRNRATARGLRVLSSAELVAEVSTAT
jgi:predicted nucleic acid-binding protein